MAAPRAAAIGTPALLRSADRWLGPSGWPVRRPGKSQRDAGSVAVFMLPRFVMCSSSRAATSAGTGEGGSPSRSSTASPARMTSSMVSRTTRLSGCV
jgi:hypothetical protein